MTFVIVHIVIFGLLFANMASFAPKNSNKSQQRKSIDNNSKNIAPIADTTKALNNIQVTLNSINDRLDKLESVGRSVDDLKADIYNENGIDHRLKVAENQTTHNGSIVEVLKSENQSLRNEVELLKNVVIRMDRKIEEMDREITDLRGRSMRDNILIHQFDYSPNEDLSVLVPAAIKKYFDIDVQFVRIHRNGNKPYANGKPVSITGKLTDRNQKTAILQAQKAKKADKIKIPFFVTAQEPNVTVENRKRLYGISDNFRKNNQSTKVVKNTVLMPNGSVYEEEVPKLSNADILQITSEEKDGLEKVELVSTGPTVRKGSSFFASGARVTSAEEVNDVYKKVCLDLDSASSNHRILVYRFMDQDSHEHCGYHDDGEHGAGRRLLRYMEDNGIMDTAVVVTRWFGGTHIGFERFQIMEGLVCEVADGLL